MTASCPCCHLGHFGDECELGERVCVNGGEQLDSERCRFRWHKSGLKFFGSQGGDKGGGDAGFHSWYSFSLSLIPPLFSVSVSAGCLAC